MAPADETKLPVLGAQVFLAVHHLVDCQTQTVHGLRLATSEPLDAPHSDSAVPLHSAAADDLPANWEAAADVPAEDRKIPWK